MLLFLVPSSFSSLPQADDLSALSSAYCGDASCDLAVEPATDDAYAGLKHCSLGPGTAQDGNTMRARHRARLQHCERHMLEIPADKSGIEYQSSCRPDQPQSRALWHMHSHPNCSLVRVVANIVEKKTGRSDQPLKASVDNRYCL